jgi:hypothetical protein
MTTDEGVTALIAAVAGGRSVGGSGADGRGPETVGSALRLLREGEWYVVEEASWHEYNGTRDRESVKRRTRTERGLRRLLRGDPALLEALLAYQAAPGAAPPRLAAPGRDEVAAREADLDAVCAQAERTLRGGEWWLGDGRAQGLVDGRGLAVAWDDTLRWLSNHPAAKLRARLRAALLSEHPMPLGALPPRVETHLRRWLDSAALAGEVERDAVVVQAFGPPWCSHEEARPESNLELALWSVHGVVPTQSLRPSAAAELPAALRAAGAWFARRNERETPRPFDPAASRLVDQAMVLAAEGPLAGLAVAPDGTREERELRRAEGSWVLIRRFVPDGGEPGEVDEDRSVDSESETRAALRRQLEWLAPAVSQRAAR